MSTGDRDEMIAAMRKLRDVIREALPERERRMAYAGATYNFLRTYAMRTDGAWDGGQKEAFTWAADAVIAKVREEFGDKAADDIAAESDEDIVQTLRTMSKIEGVDLSFASGVLQSVNEDDSLVAFLRRALNG